MPLDSDVALLGTGVAPLVAASHLLAHGKSVLILNPDWDFFLEDSELPLDPLLQKTPDLKRIQASLPEKALEVLRPDFPGPIEFWSPNMNSPEGYHDPTAPHVRQRGRLWISSLDQNQVWDWETLEDLYVEASDAGMNPQILEGLAATRRFPGHSSLTGNYRGLFLPKLYDVDSNRYRNGLLEFIRERLGSDRIIGAVNQLEWIPEGIRFHANGGSHTARLKDGMLAFWTPRLTPWIIHQAKKSELKLFAPRGIRLWEQWSLNSRDAPNPSTVGMLGDMAVWADFEGTPPLAKAQTSSRLSILRGAPLIPFDQIQLIQMESSWASSESLGALSRLCHGFLNWDRFSVRSMRARAIFEWGEETIGSLSQVAPWIRVVPSCDGPLVDVVRTARASCESILKES